MSGRENDPTKRQGTPNWADCATTNLDDAERFYADIFGWASERMPGSNGSIYSLQRLDGAMVAGIYELTREMIDMGVPPHWGTYVEVDDVAETSLRTEEEGGKLIDGPFDEPDVGTIAIIQDPVGAFLRVWHSAPGQGGQVFNVPGAMTWNELNTKEPERAARFYEAVLGVTVETMSVPTPYTTLNVGGRPVAGILRMTPEMGDFPPSWDVYFATDDVDATAERVSAAGGAVLKEPFDIAAETGRMAVLQDPQGAVFEVIKMRMAQP
jgi:predicted enzyme related to lactoylglutathione lyase